MICRECKQESCLVCAMCGYRCPFNLYQIHLVLFNPGEAPDEFPVYTYEAVDDASAIKKAEDSIEAICYEHKMQCQGYSVWHLEPGDSPVKQKSRFVMDYPKLGG